MGGAPFLLGGIFWYIAIWWRHGAGPRTRRFGTIPVPVGVRRLFRIDDGPLLLSSLISQGWAITLMGLGIWMLVARLTVTDVPLAVVVIFELGGIAVGVSWLAIALVGRYSN